MKRILSVFPGFAIGGAQMRYTALANYFGPAWQHDIVAMDGNRAAAERLDPALAVRFHDPGLVKGDTRGNITRIRAFLRELRPDVLVTHNWGSIEWAMANRVRPLVRHVHIEDGFGPEERARQLPRRVWTRRLMLRHAEVALPSQTLMQIAREAWKLPEKRLHYVPNGIDLASFPPALPRAEVSEIVFGTIATLRAEKNLARLLHAFRLVRTDLLARLVIVGDGPDSPALHALATELGLAESVTFTGHLTRPAEALAGFDVFVLSSDTEQMPLSVLEAMASGLAVAATDVGDVRAMLSAANHPYVVPQDAGKLAEAMQNLASNAPLRYEIGQANRSAIMERFDQIQMMRAYEALFFPVSAG